MSIPTPPDADQNALPQEIDHALHAPKAAEVRIADPEAEREIAEEQAGIKGLIKVANPEADISDEKESKVDYSDVTYNDLYKIASVYNEKQLDGLLTRYEYGVIESVTDYCEGD